MILLLISLNSFIMSLNYKASKKPSLVLSKDSDNDSTSNTIIVDYTLVLEISNLSPSEMKSPLLRRGRSYRCSASVSRLFRAIV